MTGFKINIDRTVTVQQLQDITRHSTITRTPHIGNLNLAELTLLTLGIPLRLVDKNLSSIDTLFNPESRIINEQCEILSTQQHTLVPYLRDKTGYALATLHTRATQQAVHNGQVSTYSLDYLKHIDNVAAVLEILADIAPEVFNRISDSEGKVTSQLAYDDAFVYFGTSKADAIRVDRTSLATRTLGYFEQVSSVIETGIPASRNSVILLKAEADIVLQSLIDTSLESSHGVRRFYQCCGIPMARYIADPRVGMPEEINRLLGMVCRRLNRPANIEMTLFPISHLRLAYINDSTLQHHYEIIVADEKLQALKQEKARRIKSAASNTERDDIICTYQSLFQQTRTTRQQHIDALAFSSYSPFYEPGSTRRLTQHDLAESGQTIQIPDHVMSMSLKSISDRLKSLLSRHPEKRARIFF